MSTNTDSLSFEKEELSILAKTENFLRFPALCEIYSSMYCAVNSPLHLSLVSAFSSSNVSMSSDTVMLIM
eukprot:CAMPEP_0173293418 /NCGR_PEP_ID=MMETSP1143-20121109/13293_1 /TAXON_ID=483371 /ORGANISM="non described non described, Strain CCMP2298" /LENGTH=69 /DNA_ID=CAMNT_0014232955 /DNA_START=1042 /DNA_END=1251 /DNA_ORIENTATION=-